MANYAIKPIAEQALGSNRTTINLLWRASEFSIRESVRSAMMLVLVDRFKSVAFPVLGSGSGGYNAESALNLMKDELSKIKGEAEVKIVRFGSRADA